MDTLAPVGFAMQVCRLPCTVVAFKHVFEGVRQVSALCPQSPAHTVTRAGVRAFTLRRRRRGWCRMAHEEATARMARLKTPSQTSLVQTPRKRIAKPKALERKGVAMTTRQVALCCLFPFRALALLHVWCRLVCVACLCCCLLLSVAVYVATRPRT